MESQETAMEAAEEGEILFVDDRRPGNVSPVLLKPSEEKPKPEVKPLEDFIPLSATDREDKKDLNETDGSLPENDTTVSTAEEPEDLMFVEDRDPQLTGQETNSPRYRISDIFVKKDEPSAKRNRLGNCCFNCGETTHSMRDCTEPKNQRLISKNRREFQDAKGSTPVYKRYHKEESQRFGHLVPGQLSAELREALGLEPNQLPSHVYMMRVLGYPPGWLEEAKVSHSGIAMFDGQGKEVADPQAEVGEVVEEGSLDKYDVRKIVRYAGFNVPPPPGTYDDSAYWRCPPMSRRQSVEGMLARLAGRVVGGYKRKKLSLVNPSDLDDSSQSAESRDMEYEEIPESTELPADNCKFVPPLPEEELPPPPPTDLPELPPIPGAAPPPPDAAPTSDADSSLASSLIEETSLSELEQQKKELLAQLNDVKPVCGTPDSKVGQIKSVDYGTPILKSVSPYARLPSADKFSVNICDVINFENLPDSTGKYEKMSGIIRKVREKVAEINSEM